MQHNNTCTNLDNENIEKVPISTEEFNNILNIQNEILAMVASHGNLTKILARLCQLAERLLPNSVASVMLLDKKTSLLSILSAPSVPEAGHEALKNLKPGPTGGSCGNAVYHNEAQYVSDTFTDSRWEDLRQTAIDFNLCSCWSMPIKDQDSKAIGTFALSSFEHRAPTEFHKKLLETAAYIVNIVLRNKKDEQRIKLFSDSMQNATEGMIITDSENRIVEVNDAFKKIYGYTEKEILGKNPKVFASGMYDKRFYNEMWHKLQVDANWSSEIVNKKADGSKITQWLSISALKDSEDETLHNYLAIFTDLSELKKVQKQLEEIAYYDSLTGLYNKTQLEKELNNHLLQSLILLNINNFSYINNAYGFNLGDKLLIEVATVLKNKFGYEHVFRVNSDEFALLFYEEINVKEIVDEIYNYFYNNKIILDKISINASFSYGAATSAHNLLRNTSFSLKFAKNKGKNNLHIFNEYTDHIIESNKESFVESNNLIYNALNDNTIVPFYQGIYDNETKTITKYEVLARIVNNGEIISPFRFLEAARLAGLIPEVTKTIVDKSFEQMSSNNYSFSINITEDDLTQNYLPNYLNEKSTQHNIDPSRVILEILEGISSNGKKNHIRQLNELKKAGYSIAIDDFGSEYSNFERVLDLDIDFLKIDAKYIKDIDTNKKSYEITKAITFFAQNTGIPCIAEFVHNESVQKIVEELNISYSQGFYFSEPEDKPL